MAPEFLRENKVLTGQRHAQIQHLKTQEQYS